MGWRPVRLLLLCGLVAALAGGCPLAPQATFGGDCTLEGGECGADFVCDSASLKCVNPPDPSTDGGQNQVTVDAGGQDIVDDGGVDSGEIADGCIDVDDDGYGEGCDLGPDCDDNNPDRAPGLTDICDGVDNNCDGVADADVTGDTVTDLCPCVHAFDSEDPLHAYLFCTANITGASRDWDSARDYCQSLEGYDLAIVNTAHEDDIIRGGVSQLAGEYLIESRAHIGITDDVTRLALASEGNWRAIDGSALAIDGWQDTEPSGGAGENCGYLEPEGWADGACDTPLQMWVCEPTSFWAQ